MSELASRNIALERVRTNRYFHHKFPFVAEVEMMIPTPKRGDSALIIAQKSHKINVFFNTFRFLKKRGRTQFCRASFIFGCA
ncbi:MAG: hypothetical protein IKD37_07310 [Clostridia bacterium]|nr:hypothetical protein [Clostridia bacterium]